MPRPTGSRSAGFDQRRTAILSAIKAGVLSRQGGSPSLRELAGHAGVSVATLRHYFDDRDGVLEALIGHFGAEGAEPLAHMAEPQGPFAASVMEAVFHLTMGFRHGLGEIHAVGLAVGLHHPRLGPAFVRSVLEPSLRATEARLSVHQDRGEASFSDVRSAALLLVSPILTAALHQVELSGREQHPMDLDAFAVFHAQAFVRAFASDADPVDARNPEPQPPL